ncbi:hypothetical protein [Burkholderia sp. Ac-20353]|uniref:hypothetical protein n=1 Tax=Burkholderia sp. Ac-20353 TaxID=2703894 RepID=UPI00197C0344|nr:hypothetical protein [Burkholderia sp. Ac-20353]MBN3785495.1 hypothetical protein [Burkholderia sp. Ac-20353]
MPYATSYVDLVYATSSNLPAVCRYRLIVAEAPHQVIVQIDNHRGPNQVLLGDHHVRHAIVNRIVDQLLGVPLDLVRVVLSEQDNHVHVRVDPDIEDYIQRGNRYKLAPEPGKRGRIYDRIAIDSRDLVSGRVRIHTVHSVATPVSADFAALLDSIRG